MVNIDASKAIGLTMNQLGVLVCLTDHMNSKRMCWPSIKTIHKYTMLGRKTIIRTKKELVELGHISDEGRTKYNVVIYKVKHSAFTVFIKGKSAKNTRDKTDTTPRDKMDTTPRDKMDTTPRDKTDTTPRDKMDTRVGTKTEHKVLGNEVLGNKEVLAIMKKGIFGKLILENQLNNLTKLKQPSLKKQLGYQRIYSDDFILKILQSIEVTISSGKAKREYSDLNLTFNNWAKREAKKNPEQAKPAKVEPKQGVLKAETFVEKAEEIFYQGIEKLKGERPSAKINPKNMQNHFVPLLDWLRTVSAKKNRKALSAIKDETVLKGLAKLISIIPQSRRSWDDLHIWRINPNRQAILEEGLEEEELSGPTYAGMPIEKAKEKRRLLKAYADQRARDWELQRQGKLV